MFVTFFRSFNGLRGLCFSPDAPAAGAPPAGAPPAGEPPAAGAPPAGPEFSSLVPAEYQNAAWVKDVKDINGLFKRTDGLIQELGKRPAGIPQDNAPAEEWQKFNKAFGVPEKPESYVLSDPPQELGPKDEAFQNGIRSVFHKAGVSTRQAKILEAGYNELVLGILKQRGEEAQQRDTDFDKLKTEVFGQRADEAINGARLLIAKFVPEKMKGHLANLPNESLIVLAGVLDAVRQEFISEDRMPKSNGGSVSMTKDQLQAKGRELMASKAYTNPFDPEHAKVKAEVEEIYQKLSSSA